MVDNRPYDTPDDGYGNDDRSHGSARDDRDFRTGGTGYGGGSRFAQQSQGGEHRDDHGYRQSSYGQQRFGGGMDDGRQRRERTHGERSNGRQPDGYRYQDRGFFDRAGDEVRSWFGDDDAERRREFDQRYDERLGNGGGDRSRDSHYQEWRAAQIAELDRDYDEYRRENATRFQSEFGAWRNERQNQRGSLGKATEHMEVVGSDGGHVGTVDKVEGDRILLTRSDPDAGGRHHSIPSRWIDRVDDKVTIRKTAEEAKAHWRDEDRTDAMFGDKGEDSDGKGRTVNLDRSFSGTY
jgi:hypothetical protein